ncbi:MAG TPA: RDD family protein [Cyclobacteriaceae bacterium]|nr:RDD family protein [Cyclobacteriaceae bacterium]
MSTGFAGFWLRFVAFIIDSIVLSVVYLILLQPFFSSVLPVGYDEWKEIGPQGGVWGFSLWAYSYLGYPELFLVVIAILYHTLMESSKYQASLGKLALELKVTDVKGDKLSVAKALVRNASKVISSLTIMIGYLMAGVTQRKQALHDIIADALVVKK